MKKFVVHVFIFSGICLGLFLGLKYAVKEELRAKSDYMASIVDKHNALAKIKGPKIIFSGGSNLVFGINCAQIQSQVGMPVMNLSLHAGLGTSFILKELKSSIKPGDIVFLSLEYLLDTDGEYKLKKKASQGFPEARNFFSYDLREEISIEIDQVRADFLALFASEGSQQKNPDLYTRKAFNPHGDIDIGSNTSQLGSGMAKPVLSYRYWETIALLNDFYRFAKSQHVDVYFVYPCFPASAYEINEEVITKVAADLTKDLSMEVLGNPTDFVFPDSLFFDTIYHLNSSGRKMRTEKLVSLLLSNKRFIVTP
jgi:hypothetical protein